MHSNHELKLENSILRCSMTLETVDEYFTTLNVHKVRTDL